MKNYIKVISIIIGTLIGAGFASGQEISVFFFSYGTKGIIGILISTILMGIIIYKTLNLVRQKDVNNYKEFLNIIIKSKNSKNYFNIKNIVNIVVNLFILITFFIMIAGFGAYFEQEIRIYRLFGSIILALISFMVFKTSQKGVVRVSGIIVPILILFIIIISILNLKDTNLWQIQKHFTYNNINFILSAILYCSYNSILLIPVLITLKSYLKNKKQVLNISIVTTIIIIILSICLFIILTKVDIDITKLEMPAVYVISRMASVFKIIYGFIILGSIFTTSIALGNSFLQNVSKTKKSYTQIAVIMCITSIIISNIGFSKLINYLYPIFGYLGIIQIIKLTTKSTQIKQK